MFKAATRSHFAIARTAHHCNGVRLRRQSGSPASRFVPLQRPAAGVSQEDFAKQLDPDAFRFMQESFAGRESTKRRSTEVAEKLSLWKQIQRYRRGTCREKSILLDSQVAQVLAELIAEKSVKGRDTMFFDCDGGLCQVTKHLLDHDAFQTARIFRRDGVVEGLQNFAMNRGLERHKDRIVSKDLNILAIATSTGRGFNFGDYVSPLFYEQLGIQDWDAVHPSYTMFATASGSLIMYLTKRYMQRLSPVSEFYRVRPEYFFLLSDTTWEGLSLCSGSLNRCKSRNVFCMLAFEFEWLMEVPRTSFFPWLFPNGSSASEAVEDSSFQFVRMRPKRDIAISSNATMPQLAFFVFSIFKKCDLRFLPLMETWCPGVGLELVRRGYGLYDTGRDLNLEDIIPLFNVMADHPAFKTSNFITQSEVFYSVENKPKEKESKDLHSAVLKLRRKYRAKPPKDPRKDDLI